MKYRISTSNERVWYTTQLAKLSFNHSIGRTHSWCFSIFCKNKKQALNVSKVSARSVLSYYMRLRFRSCTVTPRSQGHERSRKASLVWMALKKAFSFWFIWYPIPGSLYQVRRKSIIYAYVKLCLYLVVYTRYQVRRKSIIYAYVKLWRHLGLCAVTSVWCACRRGLCARRTAWMSGSKYVQYISVGGRGATKERDEYTERRVPSS